MTVIHAELNPIRYTSPGPPTKPKPLIVLENTARPVTRMPRSRPAMKKSLAEVVRRSAQTPTPTHIAR